jgi:hypothetical protein
MRKIKKTTQLFSLLEELAGHIVYMSAVAKISQHCLYKACDVWITSCLEKEEHSFLLLFNVVCQPAGIRARGKELKLMNVPLCQACHEGFLIDSPNLMVLGIIP